MNTLIILIPSVFSTIIALTRSPAKAFLNVYIPVLLLIPDAYRLLISGLPHPTFNQATIIPIVGIYLLTQGRDWRFSFTDFLILSFVSCSGYSVYINEGDVYAEHFIFDMLGSAVLPYILAKALIEPSGFRVAFAKRLVQSLFCVAVISAYEFRMELNPFAWFFGLFFPEQPGVAVFSIRWGFGRPAGPFPHAILCGLMMASVFMFQHWLEKNQLWSSKRLTRFLSIGLLAGLFMTFSRGPWAGVACGTLVTLIGRAKNRLRASIIALGAVILIGMPALFLIKQHIPFTRQNAARAASETTETVAYRMELLDTYIDVIKRGGAWGWGLNRWPHLRGMKSIDNYYLLLALRHGFMGLGLFLTILLYIGVRLAVHASKIQNQAENSFAFTLLAVYVTIAITIGTVWLGGQTQQFFFIITGWAEGLLARDPEMGIGEIPSIEAPRTPFQFRKVLT